MLSFEDDVKHPDRESNSAANKVYLTVLCNTWKNIISSSKRKNHGKLVRRNFKVKRSGSLEPNPMEPVSSGILKKVNKFSHELSVDNKPVPNIPSFYCKVL